MKYERTKFIENLLRKVLLSVLVMSAINFEAQSGGQFDAEKLFKESFIYDEAVYQNQSLKFPRSSLKNQCTLAYQLKRILGDVRFCEARISCTHMNGVEEYKCDDIEKLLSMDPLLLSFNVTDSGMVERKYIEPNIVIYLRYEDNVGDMRYVAVHSRVRGMMDKALYTRISIMIPNTTANDDIKSYNSKYNPVVFSYLNVFDVCPDDYLSFYRKVEASVLDKLKKNEELDDYEKSYVKGLKEHESLAYSLGYGEWLFGNNRYYDAYVTLEDAYDILRSNLNNNEFNTDKEFYKVCYYRGMSMAETGHYDMAYYMLGLAAYGNPEYEKKIKDTENRYKNKRYDEVCYDFGCIRAGDVMEMLFETNPENLKSAVLFNDNGCKILDSPQDVWNYNILDLCGEKPAMMTLKYTRASLPGDGNIDRSILGFENNILFMVNKVQEDVKDLWRVNVMIPNFKNIDYKYGGNKMNIPKHLSFIVGKDEKNMLKADAMNVDVVYDNAMKLYSEKRYLEAMLACKYVLNNVEVGTDTYSAAGYTVGFALHDFGKIEKSIFYMSKINKKDLARYPEFVSSLCNINDPRAYDLVIDEMERINRESDESIRSAKSFNDYFLFLKRRQAYLLIERKEYEKAKIIQNEMLYNPDLVSFAKNELEYIKSIEDKENVK